MINYEYIGLFDDSEGSNWNSFWLKMLHHFYYLSLLSSIFLRSFDDALSVWVSIAVFLFNL
jgi:VanZ family protein